MSDLGSMKLLDVRAVNRLLAGARIERVLVGCQSDVPVLVIQTDRKDPDSGATLALEVSGNFDVSLLKAAFLALPSEVVEP